MTPTVEEIVKGLSEAQRRALVRLPTQGGYIQNHFVSIRTADVLTSRKLWQGTDYGRRFTPLGLSVRTYLESMGDGNG